MYSITQMKVKWAFGFGFEVFMVAKVGWGLGADFV